MRFLRFLQYAILPRLATGPRSMISVMSKTRRGLDQNMQVRTTPKAKLALDRVVATLRASERLGFRGKQPTQEAIVNASWLWMESLGDDVLVDAMAEWLPRLEEILKGKSDLEPSQAEHAQLGPDEPPTPKRGRRSR